MAGSVAGSVTGAVLGAVATGSVFAGRVVLGAVLSCAGAVAQPVSSKARINRVANVFFIMGPPFESQGTICYSFETG